MDPYAYRFDGVPNGVYQVDLRFAELDNLGPGGGMFDVIFENTLRAAGATTSPTRSGRYAADARPSSSRSPTAARTSAPDPAGGVREAR